MDARLVVGGAEAARLAEQLAALTGETIDTAVVRALAERIEREREIRRRTEEILAVAADFRSHLRHPLPSSDTDWLYGADGLPA